MNTKKKHKHLFKRNLYNFLFLTVFLLLSPSISQSQEAETIKNLKIKLSKANSQSKKSQIHKEISLLYHNISNTDSAAVYIQKAIDFSFRSTDQEIADLYWQKAQINYQTGYYKKALISTEKCLNIVNKNKPPSFKNYPNYLFYHGLLNRILGNESKALESLTKASILANSYNLKAQIYSTISDVYASLGDNENTLNFANKITEKPMIDSISPVYIAKSYAIASHVYSVEGDNNKAINFEKKALAIYIKNKNQLGIASSLVNIADILHELGNYNEALVFLQRAKVENETLKNKYIEAGITLNSAENLAKLKRYTNAYPLFDLSAELFKNLGITQGVTEAYLEKSKTLYAENKIKKAIDFAEIALNMSQENEHLNLEESSYLFLYQIHKQQEGSTKALFYFEKYAETKDAILKEEKQQSLENLKKLTNIKHLKNSKKLHQKIN